jgi:hypothetical protein
MNTARDPRVQAWFHSLREAIASRDEPLYHERVVDFLLTQEGVLFVRRNLDTPAAHNVMAAVYRRVAPALGIGAPEDLLAQMKTLDDARTSDASGAPTLQGTDALAWTFMRYLRLGRDWARGGRLDDSYGVALAVFMFEPLLALFDNVGDDLNDEARDGKKGDTPAQPLPDRDAGYKMFA